jgi:hypothetical protein
MDVMVKMAEGNPGAMTALMELGEASAKVDPQSAFASMGPIGVALSFDTHGIYGSSIYIIWSDKCGRDARKTLVLLRAVQLGILSESKLQAMAADQMRQVDLTGEEWEDIDSKVCEQLKDFQRPVAA